MFTTGTNKSETFTGGSADDFIFAKGGHDKIYGNAGDDTAYGGTGNDSVFGGAGDDTLGGGTGNDMLGGGAGADKIYGGEGADKVYGGDGNDTGYGGKGNDMLFGGAGDDTLGGGDGNDQLSGGAGNNTLYGGAGTDAAVYDGFKVSDLTVKQVDANQYTITGKGFSDTVFGIENVMIDGKSYLIGDLVKTTPGHPGDPDPKPDVVEKTFGTLDDRHTDGNDGTEMYFGDGNLPTNYNITTNKTDGVQVGLKVHEYKGADVSPDSIDADGTAHYTVDGGPSEFRADRGDVSFDFAALFDMNDDGKTSADYTTTLKVDIDPTAAVDYFVFNSENLGPGVNILVDDARTGGFGDDDGTALDVIQNSGNFGFNFFKTAIEAKTGMPWNYEGTFDIEFSVSDANGEVATTHIVIEMEDVVAALGGGAAASEWIL